MFGRKKAPPPPRKTDGGKKLMAQMGFVGDMEDMVLTSPDDDYDYEAELRALQDEDDSGNEADMKGGRPKQGKMLSAAELNSLMDMSTADLEDADVSDTEDPDIMAELKMLTSENENLPKPSYPPSSNPPSSYPPSSYPPSSYPSSSPSQPPSSSELLAILEERSSNYQSAIHSSKLSNEISKTRRYERGLKAINEMLRDAKAGRSADQADIPPVVAMPNNPKPDQSHPPKSHPPQSHPPSYQPPSQPQPPPTQPPHLSPHKTAPNAPSPSANQRSPEYKTPPPPPSKPSPLAAKVAPLPRTPLQSLRPESGSLADYCTEQRVMYRQRAVHLKRQGNVPEAVQCMRNCKHFEAALKAIQAGEGVDMSQLPSPMHASAASAKNAVVVREALQNSPVVPQMSEEDKKKLYKVPEGGGGGGGGGLLEALQMRLEKYKEAFDQAAKEGNGGKGRRMKRIVKQYEEAVKMARDGASYDYTQLPTPPGFPPLPTESLPSQPHPASDQDSIPANQTTPPSANQKASPSANQRPVLSSRPSSATKSGVLRQASVAHSRAEQQASFLESRQTQFKRAAVDAKNSGDMELAKKYMRMAKGFDQMIDASRSGLPVDVSQIPTPPGDDSEFVFVESSDVPVEGDAKQAYGRLQDELVKQIKLSETNRDVFTKLGDISSANKFEKMGDNSRKDLDSLKNAYAHNDPVPRFHYETRQFSFVQCHHDLGDNDLEVNVVRAINLNPPSGYSISDLHTYVRYEFPFPNDIAQSGETATVKGDLNPEFNFSARLQANRSSRAFLRLLKSSKSFKFEVYYKRGFFKSDKVLGSIQFKLLPLENKCTYHDSFDLMDGRKAVGGKLEVKIRIRDPYMSKQVEEKRERWLIIDEFTRSAPPRQAYQPTERSPETQPSHQASSRPSSSTSLHCISVLAYDRDHIEQQLHRGTTANVEELRNRSAALHKKGNELKMALHKGGSAGIKDYISNLKKLSQVYTSEAVKADGNQHATKVALTKKALVHKEIESLSRKLQS